jgi:hypothetical protein
MTFRDGVCFVDFMDYVVSCVRTGRCANVGFGFLEIYYCVPRTKILRITAKSLVTFHPNTSKYLNRYEQDLFSDIPHQLAKPSSTTMQ